MELTDGKGEELAKPVRMIERRLVGLCREAR
jgi:hypothetical protein